MMNIINRFEGKYEFLRSDYPVNITLEYDGNLEVYPSVFHAFQASKTSDCNLRNAIALAAVNVASKMGKKNQLIDNWDNKKLPIMETLQRQKFQNQSLKIRLLLTEGYELIQGGMRYDKFWGADDNDIGANHAGKMIMKIREEILLTEGSAFELFAQFLKSSGFDFISYYDLGQKGLADNYE